MHNLALQTNNLTLPSMNQVTYYIATERDVGQRLDNFLLRFCKGVPKSHLYQIIRSGQLRINKKRVDAQHRIEMGDCIRIPPMQVANSLESEIQSKKLYVPCIELPILYEDEGILIINKPSGIAVHGGSGVSFGVIERLRASLTQSDHYLELVHRLDRGTSGVLVLAKKRFYLNVLQEQIRERKWKKTYTCLVLGNWPDNLKQVNLPLRKVDGPNGEKKVFVHPEGQTALTYFKVLQRFTHPTLGPVSLLEVQLITGRTHQIRVHTSAKGHPILGDERYGQFAINRLWSREGLDQMFLHAIGLQLEHPTNGRHLNINAQLPDKLEKTLNKLAYYVT